MQSFIKVFFVLCIGIFIFFGFCFDYLSAQQLFMTTDVDIESNQNSMDAKSIDDLLGPDSNFPFDPANHRDGSNPIKRIGSISDDNL
tara:strand:+ start:183 stop:443 length:261 start_codon:yes stop_codon:yes gene_type:complete